MESRRLHGAQVEPVDHQSSLLVGPLLHAVPVHATCFGVLSLRRDTHPAVEEEPTTTAAATAAAAAAAAAVATVFVRLATITRDLGQLRRLPRQAMHRAGTSRQTMRTRSSFLGRMLCLQFALFGVCFAEVSSLRLGYIFSHALLATALS